MNEHGKTSEDRRLEALFGSADELPDGNGFTRVVVARVRRSIRIRRGILAGATVLGSAIAARPVVEIMRITGEALLSETIEWSNWLASANYVALAGVLLLLLAGFGSLRWLAR